MKMKCKFFGATAKLAMAILAVGAMFTSCYDSENGDVTKPYKAPDAVYTFVVTVTNGITGNPVSDAKVYAGELECKGIGNGVYQGVTTHDQSGANKMPSTVKVKVTGNDYKEEGADVDVKEITNGQAITCYVNIVLNPTKYLPEGLKIEAATDTKAATEIHTGDKIYAEQEGVTPDETLDIINKTDEPMVVSRDIKYPAGIMYVERPKNAATRGVEEDVLAAIDNYIKAVEGVDEIGDEWSEIKEEKYSFLLPADAALQKISIQYIYDVKTYTATYGSDSYRAKTKRVASVIFSNTFVSQSMYHGHGHGHGHGGDLNAGGGIFE